MWTPNPRWFARSGAVALLAVGGAACAANTTGSSAISESPSGATSPMTSPTPTSTDGWLTFSSVSGQLSFRYDPAWKPTECPSNDSPLIDFAPNVCGQIEPSLWIDSTPTSKATDDDLRCDPTQPPAPSSSVTVDGVAGIREYVDYSASAYQNCRSPIEHALAYRFSTRGRAYTVMYLYIPREGVDKTSEVDEMVQTLRFSA
jgi:hypothetical protein